MQRVPGRLVLLTLGALVAAGRAGATPRFTGIGQMPQGFGSGAYGVSADGSVVVGLANHIAAVNSEAVSWTPGGGITPLGFLRYLTSQASGVSADGSVVVGDSAVTEYYPDPQNPVPSYYSEAFRWTAGGGMVGLGKLAGANFSSADAVSGDGEIVVGRSGSASVEAFRWTSGGGMVGLGDLPGGNFFSNALGISADGSTVVGGSESGLGTEAFRWTQSEGMMGLGALAGAETVRSFARAASADGSVIVGYSDTPSGLWEAFRWTAGDGMVGLGDLPGGTFESLAYGVSGDGSIVVGTSKGTNYLTAFLWDPVHGIRELETVLEELGLDLTGWHLTSATAISTDGRAIVGYGTNPDGIVEGWLAIIPEPATGSLLGVGLLVLACLRRRA